MRACGMLYVSRSRSQCTSLPAIYFLSRWPFRSWPATMPYVCHLPGMERNGGTAHSATGSVSSPATCNPSWTALAACTGGEGADAYAGEEDVEVSAGVFPPSFLRSKWRSRRGILLGQRTGPGEGVYTMSSTIVGEVRREAEEGRGMLAMRAAWNEGKLSMLVARPAHMMLTRPTVTTRWPFSACRRSASYRTVRQPTMPVRRTARSRRGSHLATSNDCS